MTQEAAKLTLKPDNWPEIEAEPLTDLWYAKRSTGIGGSEAAAAAGISEWSTRRQLFALKRGEIKGPEENDGMRLGKLLEPVVAQEFLRRFNAKHDPPIRISDVPCGMMRHHKHRCMFATPDNILYHDRKFQVGEWKTTSWRMSYHWGEEGTDDIPTDTICQANQEMAVTGLETTHVAVLIDGRTCKIYRVQRNEQLIDLLIEAEEELWQRIQANDPPEPDWEHPRTPDLIKAIYRDVTDDQLVELSLDAIEAVESYQKASKLKTQYEKEAKKAKARFADEIGNHFGAILPGGDKMVRRQLMPEKKIEYVRNAYVDTRIVNTPRHLKGRK